MSCRREEETLLDDGNKKTRLGSCFCCCFGPMRSREREGKGATPTPLKTNAAKAMGICHSGGGTGSVVGDSKK